MSTFSSRSSMPTTCSTRVPSNGSVPMLGAVGRRAPLPTLAVLLRLREATQSPNHQFWPNDVSVLDSTLIHAERIHGPKQLTDISLLALAKQHGGRFVTFDETVALSAVCNANKSHLVVI
jgi:uncharacterized protein